MYISSQNNNWILNKFYSWMMLKLSKLDLMRMAVNGDIIAVKKN